MCKPDVDMQALLDKRRGQVIEGLCVGTGPWPHVTMEWRGDDSCPMLGDTELEYIREFGLHDSHLHCETTIGGVYWLTDLEPGAQYDILMHAIKIIERHKQKGTA